MSIFRILKKYKQLLTKKQWNSLFPLFFLMLIAGVMETLSVSLIMPFMDIVMNPTRIRGKWYIVLIQEIFNRDDTKFILAVIALAMAVVYIVKNMYVIWEMRIQQFFVSKSMFDTQKGLIAVLMKKPYEYFLQLSSGTMLTIVYNHIASVFGLLTQVLYMFSELIVAGMLVITLFIISPIISLLIGGVLSVLMLVISRVIKPILKRASADNRDSSQELYKWILQSIQGIKEVKVLETEGYFLDKYDKAGRIYVNANCTYTVMNNLPRALIEAVTMAGFFITISIFILTGQNIGNMFPVIAAIAMAAIRLLPAANRISGALASIAFSEGYMDELLAFLNNVDNTEKSQNDITSSGNVAYDYKWSIIKIENIIYRYPNTETPVLQGASVEVKRDETIGIVGESGAGKSTLIDIAMGLLVPEAGTVSVDGVSIQKDIKGWISNIGYIPQSIFMLDDNIRKNVAFGISTNEIDDDKVWRALDDAALGDFIRGMPDGLDTQIGERGMRLSGGQRQRIGIARALYRDPQILFFDEATSALDNETEKEIMVSINGLKGHKTMVIIAHRLTTIESCDHIYRVENGKIIQER